MITKPTRVTQSSATLIDHIYSNNIEYLSSSGIIITDSADNFGIFHSISGNNHPDRTQYKCTRILSDANLTKFKTYLDETDFNNILKINCPYDAYDKFILLHKVAFERAFPMRKVKFNKKYIKREPWITAGLLESSINKTKLFTKKLKNPTEHNINKFKDYNKLFNKIKKNMKINYHSSTIKKKM